MEGQSEYRGDGREREKKKTSRLVRNNKEAITLEMVINYRKVLFSPYDLWITAKAQARKWWITKRWKSKEVESLTDNKSSSPFW